LNHLFFIIAALALVLLNAFFVAAEFAMVRLRPTRVETIKAQYGLKGKVLSHMQNNLDAYLSVCQLGITIASLGLGWIGEPAFAGIITQLLSLFHIQSEQLITVISFVTAFTVISILHIVVGELMPKSLAIRQAEKISIWTSIPLYGFYWIMYPAIWLLNNCSNYLLYLCGLHESATKEHSYTAEELKLLLGASHLHGELTKEEMEIIAHTLDLAELEVTEVMRHNEEMIEIDISKPPREIIEHIFTHRYSRYPVYDPEVNDIIGIIHVKDLFPLVYKEREQEIRSIIRPALKVPKNLPALDLLQQFRQGLPHFALVYSGRNTVLGFITLDNLLQVLIGRIKDEFHRTEVDWSVNKDGSITAHGNCTLYALEQALNYDLHLNEEEEELNTVNGLLLHRLNRVPKEGELLDFPDFSAKITKARKSRVLQLVIHPKAIEEE